MGLKKKTQQIWEVWANLDFEAQHNTRAFLGSQAFDAEDHLTPCAFSGASSRGFSSTTSACNPHCDR
jgi:hypothetical protein